MKNYNKKLNILSSALLLFGGVSALASCSNPTNVESQDQEIISRVEEGKGMSIKTLRTGTNSEGKQYKVFSWTITPGNATDKSVTASVSMEGYTTDQIAGYVTVAVNNQDQTVTVTCLNPFSTQIVLTLTSNSNSDAHASVTLDYLEKFLGFKSEANRTDGPVVLRCDPSYTSESAGLLPWAMHNYDYAPYEWSHFTYAMYSETQDGDWFNANGFLLTNPGGEYYGGDVAFPDSINTDTPGFINGHTFASGFSSVYSKQLNKNGYFTFSFTQPSFYKLDIIPYENYTADADYRAAKDLMADINDTEGESNGTISSSGINSVGNYTWRDMVYGKIKNYFEDYCSMMPEDAQTLSNAKSKIALVGLRGTFSLTVSCENGAYQKTYSKTIFLATSPSDISFYEPVTSLSPEVAGVEF